jgi:hypothetical protein
MLHQENLYLEIKGEVPTTYSASTTVKEIDTNIFSARCNGLVLE